MVKKIIGGIFVLGLIVMQFFQIDKTNPPVVAAKTISTVSSPPQEVLSLLKTACFDCHSNETQYPWYANVAPVSWWIKGHIDHGRSELNYSEWGDYDADDQIKKMKKAHRFVRTGLMPMASYTIGHKEARLTPPQKILLMDWFQSQVPGGDLSE